MKIPAKYKETKASLMDLDGCDYTIPDILNYVLEEGQDQNIFTVADLTDKQCRIALCIYINNYRRTLAAIERVVDIVHTL